MIEISRHRLDGGPPFELALDLRRHAAPLADRVDLELVIGRGVVAAIAGIGDAAIQHVADERFHLRNDRAERVSVIRVAGQRCGMGDELAAGGMLHRGGDAHLHPELVRPVRLALADALDLWCVQGIDLAATLAAPLIDMYLAGVSVRRVEDTTEALWGTRVSPSTVSDLNKKIYGTIETWRNRPIEGEHTVAHCTADLLRHRARRGGAGDRGGSRWLLIPLAPPIPLDDSRLEICWRSFGTLNRTSPALVCRPRS
jgi:hypothetical protein